MGTLATLETLGTSVGNIKNIGYIVGNIGNIGHTVRNFGWDLPHVVHDMPTLLVAVFYIKLWLVWYFSHVLGEEVLHQPPMHLANLGQMTYDIHAPYVIRH